MIIFQFQLHIGCAHHISEMMSFPKFELAERSVLPSLSEERRSSSMGIHSLTFEAEKAVPAAQVAPNFANVLPFNNRVRLLAKYQPVTSSSEARSPKKVTRPLLAGTEGSGWSGPKGVIIDFAHANQDWRATQEREYLSSEKRAGLTAMDCAAIAYVALSAAFYPAMAWLLSS
jgi:hypothetical protein